MQNTSEMRIARAVVLAAGTGSRLGERTREHPKPLLPIHGRPLIDYTMDALALSGIASALVVTGYREDQLRAALADPPVAVSFASNPLYRSEASHSLQAAREYCGNEPFLLLMSDHLVSPGLLASLLAQAAAPGEPGVTTLIAADAGEHPFDYVDEATRLAIDDAGFVTAIGKQLPAWDALDCGVFACTADVWEAADAVDADCTLSTIFGELARRRKLRTADVTGNFWYDVDTEEDCIAAEALLAASQSLHG